MEGYAITTRACSAGRAVASSPPGSNELHALGHLAGIYGSAASTIRDMQALATTASAPDDIWIGDWNGNESVFGRPYVSDALWTNHQRLHQYRGGAPRDLGRRHDRRRLELRRRRRRRLRARRPPVHGAAVPLRRPGAVRRRLGERHPTGSRRSAGRSAPSSNPSSSRCTPAAAGRAGAGLRRAADTASSCRCSRPSPPRSRQSFAAPLTIHIAAAPTAVAPMTSSDGSDLAARCRRSSAGRCQTRSRAGYTRNPDGSVRHPDDRGRLLRAPPGDDAPAGARRA